MIHPYCGTPSFLQGAGWGGGWGEGLVSATLRCDYRKEKNIGPFSSLGDLNA